MSQRVALDDWLESPFGKQALHRKALLKYLGPAAS
jgi:hypothetical protein